ncbi:MAG: hypothetical protein PHS30_06955 [Bacteroidales bacterium]|nr:hypothetical protein [Bacteroidales bacterium]
MHTKRECAEMMLRTQCPYIDKQMPAEMIDKLIEGICQRQGNDFINDFKTDTGLSIEYFGGGMYKITY